MAMVSRLHALAVRSSTPESGLACWAGVLGWEREGPDVVPGTGARLQRPFTLTDLPQNGLRQVHHLTSNATCHGARVARALEMADPGANEFRIQLVP